MATRKLRGIDGGKKGDGAPTTTIRVTASWEQDLRLSESGAPIPSPHNAEVFMVNSQAWHGKVWWDVLAGQVRTVGPPYPKMRETPAPPATVGPRDWEEVDTTRMRNWLLAECHIKLSEADAWATVLSFAKRRQISPIVEHLESLPLRPPVGKTETWLIDYLGAKDTPYTRAVAEMFLISAVARAYEPGCKVDTILVLEGPQEIGKTQAVQILAMRDEWTCELKGVNLGSIAAQSMVRGVWPVEISELDAIGKTDPPATKAFLSARVDRFRAAYARTEVRYPRMCVFIGTTNEYHYLVDTTGNRRYMPILCGETQPVDLAGLQAAVESLWAEAREKYKGGVKWYVTDPVLKALFREEQMARMVQDEWAESLQGFVSDHAEVGFTSEQALRHLGADHMAKVPRSDYARLGLALKSMGFSAKRILQGNRQVRLYFKTDK